MSLEICVFSAILRHRCPHCCSCIVRDFYLFSPFPTAKSNALCPVFCHRYTDSKLWLVYKRSLPGGLSKMAAGKFLASKIRHANISEALSSLLQRSVGETDIRYHWCLFVCYSLRSLISRCSAADKLLTMFSWASNIVKLLTMFTSSLAL